MDESLFVFCLGFVWHSVAEGMLGGLLKEYTCCVSYSQSHFLSCVTAAHALWGEILSHKPESHMGPIRPTIKKCVLHNTNYCNQNCFHGNCRSIGLQFCIRDTILYPFPLPQKSPPTVRDTHSWGRSFSNVSFQHMLTWVKFSTGLACLTHSLKIYAVGTERDFS